MQTSRDEQPAQMLCDKLLDESDEDSDSSEPIEYKDETDEDAEKEKPVLYKVSDMEQADFGKCKDFISDPNTLYFGVPKYKCKSANEFFEDGVTHRIKVQLNNSRKEIIAFVEILTSLPLDCLAPECWKRYVELHYCINLPVNFANSIFVKHMSYNVKYADDAIYELFSEVYLRELRVRNIIVLEMPQMVYSKKQYYPTYTHIKKYSVLFFPKVYTVNHPNVPKIIINIRDTFVQKMVYRKAVPEDNDDLVRIVDLDYPNVKENLGDFYIAEAILEEAAKEKQTSTILCCEIANVTSGFMWFNINVDIESIIKDYEVDNFQFLIKYNPGDPQKEMCFPSHEVQDLSGNQVFRQDRMYQLMQDILKRHSSTRKSVSSSPTASEESFETAEMRQRYLNLEELFAKWSAFNRGILSKENFSNLTEKEIRVPYNVIDHRDDISLCTNAFALQLFGLADTVDIRRGFRVLISSFILYKDRDYCIMSIPNGFNMSKGTEELLRHFVPVPPRMERIVSDRLFLTHRSAIHGDIMVQQVIPEDVPTIEALIMPTGVQLGPESTQVRQAEAVREILDDVLVNPESPFKFLTIRVGNSLKPEVPWTIIGYVILRNFTQAYLLKRQYRLNTHAEVAKERSEIISLTLHPLYQCMSDELFREIARFMDVWNFIYFIPLKSMKKTMKNDLVFYMQPLQPRSIKKSWFIKRTVDMEAYDGREYKIGKLNYEFDYFSVFQRSLAPAKVFRNSQRIVVLGFSKTAKAFLRLLIFIWKTQPEQAEAYTCVTRVDVTVICTPGVVDCEFDSHFACDICENPKYCWTNLQNYSSFIRDSTHRLDLRVWMNFVYANPRHIDRENRTVITTENCSYPYDILIFMCFRQYGFPIELKPEVLPINFAKINYRLDKINLFFKIKTLLQDPHGHEVKIVVYGPHIAPFECINFLLNHGVDKSQITLVIPYCKDMELHNVYNIPHSDTCIEYKLQIYADAIGIKILEHYHLTGYSYHDDGQSLASLNFVHYFSKEERIVPVDFFICFNELRVDKKTANICETSGIKMEDQYILIDENFQTNDPHIYAAGSFVKHFKKPNHQYRFVSPRERAEKLITALKLGEFKPQAPHLKDKYVYSHLYHAVVLNNIYFVKVVLPKRYLRNMPTNEYTKTLKTSTKNSLVRIRLNMDGIVEEIVAFTKIKKNYDFLQMFVGKHESLLNDLESRYCSGEIPCFLEFLAQPWTELICHDLFFLHVHKPIANILRTYLSNNFSFDESRDDRYERMEKDIVSSRLENIVMGFLRNYRYDFDYTFALPEDFTNDHLENAE